MADIRPFIPNSPGRLPCPTFPVPDINQFIHGFGPVRYCFRFGITGWSGEDTYVDAKRVFSLDSKFKKNAILNYKSRCGFKRFLADGNGIARAEIGIEAFRLARKKKFSPIEMIKSQLKQPVKVKPINPLYAAVSSATTTALADAGPFVSDLYFRGSTIKEQRYDYWHQDFVIPGSPLLVVQFEEEHEEFNALMKTTSLVTHVDRRADSEVRHCWLQRPNKNPLGMWIINHKYDGEDYDLRKFRKHLARLHSERQCLKIVLREISRGHIEVKRGTLQSDNLQSYLRRASKLFLHREMLYENKINSPVNDALDYEELVSPGARCSLGERLSDIRGQIRKKLEMAIEEDVHRRDSRRNWIGHSFVKIGAINLTEKKIKIGDIGSFQGNLTQAESIEGSFNSTSTPGQESELDGLLKTLFTQVTQLCKELDQSRAEQVRRDLELLVAEAKSSQPRQKWYELSAEGLLEAAKSTKALFDPISKTIKSIISLLAEC